VARRRNLAHELAHVILHEEYDSRRIAELEAESVAFIVCYHIGIHCDDYSFGYVASLADGRDEALKAIKACGSPIQKTADQILPARSRESAAAWCVAAVPMSVPPPS
jgi:hypothetical protein